MKLSFLILFFLVLNSAGRGTEPSLPSPDLRPDKHEVAANDIGTNPDTEPKKPTPFQIETLEALRAIAKQQKTAYEQYRADQKSWYSPAVFIEIGLLLVAGVYTFFTWRQWQAIHRQADITERAIVDLQRPWLIFEPETPDFSFVTDETTPFPHRLQAKWSIINTTDFPAFLTSLSIQLTFRPVPRPDEQAPTYRNGHPLGDFVIRKERPHSHTSSIMIDEGQFRRFVDGPECLMVYGIINYHGPIGESNYRTRFCCYWFYMGDIRAYSPTGPQSFIEYT